MTILLFQTDSTIKAFEARITAVDNYQHAVLLDQTAFFPGGGGQLFDEGKIIQAGKDLGFLRARTLQGEVWHFLDKDVPLPEIGTLVQCILDWERRYKLMRTHTAMHILCGVIYRDYGALVTGGDMDILQARMDFEFEHLHKELIAVIEKAVNEEVAAAHEVDVRILEREEAFQIPDLIRTKINLLPEHIQQIRIVEIKGLDLQADGGTHVNNTKEVGTIHITEYKSKGKINKRIYVALEP